MTQGLRTKLVRRRVIHLYLSETWQRITQNIWRRFHSNNINEDNYIVFFHDCVFITCKIFLSTFCISPCSFTICLTQLWHAIGNTKTENTNIKTENPNSNNYKLICSLCQVNTNVFAGLLICCYFARQDISQGTHNKFLLRGFYFWFYQNKSGVVQLSGGWFFFLP